MLFCLLFNQPIDVVNSHKVQPFSAVNKADNPDIELMYTWDVAVAGGHKLTIKAAKMLDHGGLILFADNEDEIVLAVNKTHLLYAKKVKEDKP